MLTNFKAALQSVARPRQFEEWARIVADLVAAEAVAIVSADGSARILATCANSSLLTPEMVAATASVGISSPRRVGPEHMFFGERTGLPEPHARAVKVLMNHESGRAVCIIFLCHAGIRQPTLARIETLGERRMSEVALLDRYRADLKRFLNMFERLERTAKIGLWEIDLTTREVRATEEVRRILGLSSRQPITPVMGLAMFPRAARRRLLEAAAKIRSTGVSARFSLPVNTAAGGSRTVRIYISAHTTPTGGPGLAGVLQDVSEQQQANERLWWTANHDPLTELPNRSLFADRLAKALPRASRNRRLACLILLDADKFKIINDTYGHAAGDELLRTIAGQLRASVRSHDTVARTGGDEFSMLIEDLDDMNGLEAVFRRLRRALIVRFTWHNHTMDVSLSAGAALAPHHGSTEQELTTAADLALYRMKEQQGPSLALYKPSFGHAALERSRILADARTALTAGRILPYYQPQFDTSTGEVVAVEALARWVSDDGVLTATEFADALADRDVGAQIGQTVALRALKDMANLNRGRSRKIGLALNLSVAELTNGSLLGKIVSVRRETDNRDPLTIEITEDAIVDDPGGIIAQQMRAVEQDPAVVFSLDDFGAGFGSFVHLTQLPIREVKVDRRFIAGIENEHQKRDIIRGVLDVAKSLHLRVVLEGIETAEQAEVAKALGGRFVQGFHYRAAVPLAQLARIVSSDEAAKSKAA
ncbi:MAG: EAL domain-containing protein [Pseudomonadota bacterium]